jgi:hypothetical protein
MFVFCSGLPVFRDATPAAPAVNPHMSGSLVARHSTPPEVPILLPARRPEMEVLLLPARRRLFLLRRRAGVEKRKGELNFCYKSSVEFEQNHLYNYRKKTIVISQASVQMFFMPGPVIFTAFK